MTKPIRPDEIGEAKKSIIPDTVIEAFNEEIAANYTNGKAKVLQKDVVERIRVKLKFNSTHDIYKNGWLNVEELYRAEGWSVEYAKPIAYAGEEFEAYFEFKKA